MMRSERRHRDAYLSLEATREEVVVKEEALATLEHC